MSNELGIHPLQVTGVYADGHNIIIITIRSVLQDSYNLWIDNSAYVIRVMEIRVHYNAIKQNEYNSLAMSLSTLTDMK